jgi:hypothetical protein
MYEIFFSSSFYCIVGLCASVISLGHLVVAEVEDNWYLRDINIFPLLKKYIKLWHAIGCKPRTIDPDVKS